MEVWLSNCHSSASVMGQDYVGGLVGTNGGAVVNSYSNGRVLGETRVGGLIGGDAEAAEAERETCVGRAGAGAAPAVPCSHGSASHPFAVPLGVGIDSDPDADADPGEIRFMRLLGRTQAGASRPLVRAIADRVESRLDEGMHPLDIAAEELGSLFPIARARRERPQRRKPALTSGAMSPHCVSPQRDTPSGL